MTAEKKGIVSKGIRPVLAAVACLAVAVPAIGQELSVDCSKKYQTMVGLGTCGMHWTGNMPPNLYESKDVQKLFVEDLGASIVRFCVPPGVLKDEVAEAKDISYKNFKIDAGSQKALDYVAAVYAANPKEMTVIASVWSPPAWMKTNGKTANGGSLKTDKTEHYAKYLAEWVLYMKDTLKTPVHYFSLQNELSFVEPYDSCVYKADQYAQTALALCDAFKAANVDTKLFGPEEMTWNFNNIVKCIKPIISDPRGKERFLAAASHGYSDGIQASGSAQDAAKLWQALAPMGVQWWMSETSGTAPTFFGVGNDKNGKPNPGAFSLATSIHNALVYGNASAWVYWCISGHSKSASDNAAKEALMTEDKPYKKFYASKQFYKYIRPGAVRVDAGPDGENNIQISSFIHEKNRTLTIILLNHDTKEATVTIGLKSAPPVAGFEAFHTTESDDFKKLENVSAAGGKAKIILAAQSITTLFGEAKAAAASPVQEAKPVAAAQPAAGAAAAKPASTAAPAPAAVAAAEPAAPAQDDPESQAKRKLASAKMYVESDPAKAKDILRKIIQDYPNTETAKDARRELSKIN